MADEWRTPETDALIDAILRLDEPDEAERFLRDLCTLGELRDMAQRWAVVRLLDDGLHYAEISKRTGASTATITRIASWLNHGEGGYRRHAGEAEVDLRRGIAPLPDRHRAMRDRLRLAIPNKGRLLESTLSLLARRRARVRGARPQPRRARPEPPARHPVRAHERRGRVRRATAWPTSGITGGDLLAESGVDLPVLRELGYGRCRLAAAVSGRRPVPVARRPRRRPGRDLAPQRDPPRSSRARGSPSRSCPLSGAVEVAPRLGLADAIVDLVSTGSTLQMNGLRAIGDILASEAILVANPAALRRARAPSSTPS